MAEDFFYYYYKRMRRNDPLQFTDTQFRLTIRKSKGTLTDEERHIREVLDLVIKENKKNRA